MLDLTADVHEAMLAHALDGLPDEACGLFAAEPATGRIDLGVVTLELAPPPR